MNAAINLLKWPVILWLALLAWFAVRELRSAAVELMLLSHLIERVIAGMGLYAALFLIFLRKSSTAVTVRTLEHEAAHLLASIITFNGVKAIEARDSGEGRVLLEGSGNWIVSVAPYVLPLPIIVASLVLRSAQASEVWPWLLLGFSLGFYIHSTWIETHHQQPDLKEIGWVSAWILLAACHILVVTWVCGLLLGNQRHLHAATRLTAQKIVGVALDPSRSADKAIEALRKVQFRQQAAMWFVELDNA